jgi:hypothetical protein
MSTVFTSLSPTILDPPVTCEINPTIAYEDQLFTRKRVAAWIGVHPDTLGIWERQGRGPKVTRVGRTKIRFRLGDVLQWLSSQRDAPPESRKKSNTRWREHPPCRCARKGNQKSRSQD